MVIEPVTAFTEILRAFEQLSNALIDTSSIIYLQKAGYFDLLAKAIQLYSIPEVIAEVKTGTAGLRVIRAPGSPSLSTDRKLVCCALGKKMALISEDKSVLLAMRRVQAPYYNSLMMLNFLLFLQKIDDDSYRHYYGVLKAIARYSEEVWGFGRQIHTAVKSKINSGVRVQYRFFC